MSDSYYVRIRGRVNGPYEEAKLLQLVQRGQLTKSHEVSLDAATWVPAETIASVFGNRQSISRLAAGKTHSETEQTGDPSPLFQSPERQLTAWSYAIDGEQKGPVSHEEIKFLASLGKIDYATLFWKQGMVDWQSAGSIPEIRVLLSNDEFEVIESGKKIGSAKLAWGELFPIFTIVNDDSWSFGWVQCLAIALLFPLFALEYHGSGSIDLTWASAIFSLYFSLLWTAFFHWSISPDKISPWRIFGVWLFTGTLGLVIVLIASILVLPLFSEGMEASTQASFLRRVVSWTFGVGVVEEAGKLIALLVVASRMSVKHFARSYCFLGAVSGLAFGTIEAVAYTHSYVAMHEGSSDPDAYGTLFFSLILRWLSLPLLHAVWAGISGYFLGLSYCAPQNSWRWIFFGLGIAALLHGLYDVGAGDPQYSWLAVSSATVSLALLIGYLRSEPVLVRRVRSVSTR
jgi:RsiW-degrading membrane proteinase PrsW (M82 family)